MVSLLGREVVRRNHYFPNKVLGMSDFMGRRVSPVLVVSLTGRFIHLFGSVGCGGVIAVRTSNVTPTVVINCLAGLPIIFIGGGRPGAVRNVVASIIRSFAGSHSCAIYIDGDCLAPRSRILFVSSFLTGNGTSGNIVSLYRGTNTGVRTVNFVVRGTFRRNNSFLHGRNVHCRTLTAMRDLSSYGVILGWCACCCVLWGPPISANNFYYFLCQLFCGIYYVSSRRLVTY